MIVTDVLENTSKRVLGLIADDARKDPVFGRISICENIVIDPKWAEPAEVFAVSMDERGRQSFVRRLSKLFPGLREEVGESSPELVTQLTEVGHATLFRGAEAAPLVEPPDAVRPFIANRSTTTPDRLFGEPNPGLIDDRRPGGFVTSPRPDAPSVPDRVVASRPSEDSPDFVGPPSSLQPPRLNPGDPVTLLVWVTRSVKH